jgi:anaerobic selenocysteine-containing dehydrogenase
MNNTGEIKKIRTICPWWACPSYDGLVATVDVKKNKIIKMEGDKNHPQSKGYACPKGLNDWQVIYHPDRFTKPLLRTGSRFKEISWEEATEIAADRLGEIIEKYYPKSVCCTTAEWPSVRAFMKTINSPNTMTNRDLCQGTAETADPLTYGDVLTIYRSSQDFKNSKCILLVGTNLPHSCGGQWQDIKTALSNDAKLIVVDPRRCEAAEAADLYLQIRPGTDGALALAMINVIIKENLYDEKFVSNYCLGFDKLSDHVQQYTPEWASKVTSLSVDEIEKAARMYATNGPASYRGNNGICQHSNSTQACRAFAALISICGNIDIKGGNRLQEGAMGSKSTDVGLNINLDRELMEQMMGTNRFPLWAGPDAIMKAPHNPSLIDGMIHNEPYPVKAWIVFWNNPVMTYASSQKIIEAMKKIEFLMVMAYTPSPTSDLADLILPIKHLYEYDFIRMSSYGSWFSAMPKLVDAPQGCRDSFQIFHDIAEKMVKKGYIKENNLSWKNAQEFIDQRFGESSPINYENLCKMSPITWEPKYKKYEKEGFKTPSKKVELYSERMEKLGYEPLPTYHECGDSAVSLPHLGERYPLYLTTRRVLNYLLSRGAGYPWVKKECQYPELLINPGTANERGIKDGDMVVIENPKGSVQHIAKLTDGIRADTVNGVYGWWMPEKKTEEKGYLTTNINFLCSFYPPYDPEIGINCLQGVMCQVRKQ